MKTPLIIIFSIFFFIMPFALTSPVPEADPDPNWFTDFFSDVASSTVDALDAVKETVEDAAKLAAETTKSVWQNITELFSF